MKRILLAILLVFGYAETTLSDAFQFVREGTGAFMVEAEVHFKGKLIGYTNDQGVIFITSPLGDNVFLVKHMGRTMEVKLNVKGDSKLQIIQIQ